MSDRAPPFWLLAAVTMTGTAALHGFIPALPMVAADFGATRRTAQLTITLYLVGMAGGQLVHGPLSDRFGRRGVLLWSQAIYLAGLVLGAVAPGIGVLLAARMIQAIGGSGALVLGRAMVRDVSGARDAARQLSALGLVMSLTPALAPAAGLLVTQWLGWRAIFVLLTVVVGALTLVVLRRMPETNRTPTALPGPAAMISRYAGLWRSPAFRRFTIAGACSATSLYGFFAAAPFLLTRTLHRPPSAIGESCLLVVVGMMAGTAISRQIARRVPILVAARLGNALCVTGAALLMLSILAGSFCFVGLLACLVAYAIGVGIVSPNSLAGLMNTHPEQAGSASSLYGCLQMACGALFTLFVSAEYGPAGFPVALSLLAASACTGVSLAGLTGQRSGER